MVYDEPSNHDFQSLCTDQVVPPPKKRIEKTSSDLQMGKTPRTRRKPRRRLGEPSTSLFRSLRDAETSPHVVSNAERLALGLMRCRRKTYGQHSFEKPTRFLYSLKKKWWPSKRRLYMLCPSEDMVNVDDTSPYAVTASGNAAVVGNGMLHIYCCYNVAGISLPCEGATSLALFDDGFVAVAFRGSHYCNATLAQPVTLKVGHADVAGLRASKLQLYDGQTYNNALAFSEVSAMRFLSQGGGSPLLAVGNRIGSVRIWEVGASPTCVLSIEADSWMAPSVVDIHGEGNVVYVSRMGDIEDNLAMWDLRMAGNGPFVTYKGHVNCFKTLRFDVHDGLLVAGGDDHVVRVWDAGLGGLPVASLDFSDDVEDVCIGGLDEEGGWVGGLCAKTVRGDVQVCGLPETYCGRARRGDDWAERRP